MGGDEDGEDKREWVKGRWEESFQKGLKVKMEMKVVVVVVLEIGDVVFCR